MSASDAKKHGQNAWGWGQQRLFGVPQIGFVGLGLALICICICLCCCVCITRYKKRKKQREMERNISEDRQIQEIEKIQMTDNRKLWTKQNMGKEQNASTFTGNPLSGANIKTRKKQEEKEQKRIEAEEKIQRKKERKKNKERKKKAKNLKLETEYDKPEPLALVPTAAELQREDAPGVRYEPREEYALGQEQKPGTNATKKNRKQQQQQQSQQPQAQAGNAQTYASLGGAPHSDPHAFKIAVPRSVQGKQPQQNQNRNRNPNHDPNERNPYNRNYEPFDENFQDRQRQHQPRQQQQQQQQRQHAQQPQQPRYENENNQYQGHDYNRNNDYHPNDPNNPNDPRYEANPFQPQSNFDLLQNQNQPPYNDNDMHPNQHFSGAPQNPQGFQSDSQFGAVGHGMNDVEFDAYAEKHGPPQDMYLGNDHNHNDNDNRGNNNNPHQPRPGYEQNPNPNPNPNARNGNPEQQFPPVHDDGNNRNDDRPQNMNIDHNMNAPQDEEQQQQQQQPHQRKQLPPKQKRRQPRGLKDRSHNEDYDNNGGRSQAQPRKHMQMFSEINENEVKNMVKLPSNNPAQPQTMAINIVRNKRETPVYDQQFSGYDNNNNNEDGNHNDGSRIVVSPVGKRKVSLSLPGSPDSPQNQGGGGGGGGGGGYGMKIAKPKVRRENRHEQFDTEDGKLAKWSARRSSVLGGQINMGPTHSEEVRGRRKSVFEESSSSGEDNLHMADEVQMPQQNQNYQGQRRLTVDIGNAQNTQVSAHVGGLKFK